MRMNLNFKFVTGSMAFAKLISIVNIWLIVWLGVEVHLRVSECLVGVGDP